MRGNASGGYVTFEDWLEFRERFPEAWNFISTRVLLREMCYLMNPPDDAPPLTEVQARRLQEFQRCFCAHLDKTLFGCDDDATVQ